MDSHHWSYDILKDIISNKQLSLDEFDEIRDMFEDEINSTRVSSRIRTIPELLNVLEKRNVLDNENIEPLKEISKTYNDKNLSDQLENYPKIFAENIDGDNCYAAERIRENISSNNNRINHINIQSDTADIMKFTGIKRDAIYKLISTEIGRKWREFGRHLGIKQGEMDSIENRFPRDLQSRVYAMFTLFEEDEREDPRRYVILICAALDQCRRKDLTRKINENLAR